MDDQDPTPIQKRLRPRTRAPGSEADAEDDVDASPVRRMERSLPGRRAKRAAIEALKGGESTGEENEPELQVTSPECMCSLYWQKPVLILYSGAGTASS